MSQLASRLQTFHDSRSTRVIESHHAYLAAMAQKRFGHSRIGAVTASDLVQETLLAAIVARTRGQGPAHGASDHDFLCWLTKIFHNKVNEAIRRDAGKITQPIDPETPGEGSTPIQSAIASEEWVRLEEAINMLSPKDRQIVVWLIKDGHSLKQIGQLLDVTTRHARNLCERAKQHLHNAYRATRRDDGDSL